MHTRTYVLVHKQMYWIRTNLRRFRPSNIKCNIRMLMIHYIMEYFSNLSTSCPLHEQPKDEIVFSSHCIMQLHVCLTASLLEENILVATLTHMLPL